MTDKELMVELTTKDIISFLMEDRKWDLQTALRTFYSSKTFESLEDERTGLYYKSPAYVYNYMQKELQ